MSLSVVATLLHCMYERAAYPMPQCHTTVYQLECRSPRPSHTLPDVRRGVLWHRAQSVTGFQNCSRFTGRQDGSGRWAPIPPRSIASSRLWHCPSQATLNILRTT